MLLQLFRVVYYYSQIMSNQKKLAEEFFPTMKPHLDPSYRLTRHGAYFLRGLIDEHVAKHKQMELFPALIEGDVLEFLDGALQDLHLVSSHIPKGGCGITEHHLQSLKNRAEYIQSHIPERLRVRIRVERSDSSVKVTTPSASGLTTPSTTGKSDVRVRVGNLLARLSGSTLSTPFASRVGSGNSR